MRLEFSRVLCRSKLRAANITDSIVLDTFGFFTKLNSRRTSYFVVYKAFDKKRTTKSPDSAIRLFVVINSEILKIDSVACFNGYLILIDQFRSIILISPVKLKYVLIVSVFNYRRYKISPVANKICGTVTGI